MAHQAPPRGRRRLARAPAHIETSHSNDTSSDEDNGRAPSLAFVDTSNDEERSYRGVGMTQIPLGIFNNTNLKSLDLSHNAIEVLPAQVGLLLNLTSLNVSHNRLTVLPRVLADMPALRFLIIEGNLLHQRVKDAHATGELFPYLRLGEPVQHDLAEMFSIFHVASAFDARSTLVISKATTRTVRFSRLLVELPVELRFEVFRHVVHLRDDIRGSINYRPTMGRQPYFPSDECVDYYCQRSLELMNRHGTAELNRFAIQVVAVRVTAVAQAHLVAVLDTDPTARQALRDAVISLHGKLQRALDKGSLPQVLDAPTRESMVQDLLTRLHVQSLSGEALAERIADSETPPSLRDGEGEGKGVEVGFTVVSLRSAEKAEAPIAGHEGPGVVVKGERAPVAIISKRNKNGVQFKVSWNDGSEPSWHDVDDLRMDLGLRLLELVDAFERGDSSLESAKQVKNDRIQKKLADFEAKKRAAAEEKEAERRAAAEKAAEEAKAAADRERRALLKAEKARHNEENRQKFGGKRKG